MQRTPETTTNRSPGTVHFSRSGVNVFCQVGAREREKYRGEIDRNDRRVIVWRSKFPDVPDVTNARCIRQPFARFLDQFTEYRDEMISAEVRWLPICASRHHVAMEFTRRHRERPGCEKYKSSRHVHSHEHAGTEQSSTKNSA